MIIMTRYYFFDEYGECFAEKDFATEDAASDYADKIGAEMFCSDDE